MKKTLVAVCTATLVLAACSSSSKKSDTTDTGMSGSSHSSDSAMSGTTSSSDTISSGQSGTTDSSTPGMSGDASSSGASTQPFSRDTFVSEMILNQMHHMNQSEIQMAQLAQEKASSEQIKTMARQITTDHENMEKQVQKLAQAQGITLSSFQPATYERSTMDRLNSLSGSQFDQAFMWTMHNGHQNMLSDLRMFRKDTKNPQMTSLISQAVPKIEQHAKMSSKWSNTQMGGESGEKSSQSSESMTDDQAGQISDESMIESSPTSDSSLTEGTSPSESE